jgi:hypothetical protein
MERYKGFAFGIMALAICAACTVLLRKPAQADVAGWTIAYPVGDVSRGGTGGLACGGSDPVRHELGRQRLVLSGTDPERWHSAN